MILAWTAGSAPHGSRVVPFGPAGHVEASNARVTLDWASFTTSMGLSYSTSTSMDDVRAKGTLDVPVAGAVAGTVQTPSRTIDSPSSLVPPRVVWMFSFSVERTRWISNSIPW